MVVDQECIPDPFPGDLGEIRNLDGFTIPHGSIDRIHARPETEIRSVPFMRSEIAERRGMIVQGIDQDFIDQIRCIFCVD